MPWPAILKIASNDSISRPNSRPKLLFPENGKGNYKMPREWKGKEIWGLYSQESRETGIPAHPQNPILMCSRLWSNVAGFLRTKNNHAAGNFGKLF